MKLKPCVLPAYSGLRFTTIVLLASATSFLTRGISVQALHVEKGKMSQSSRQGHGYRNTERLGKMDGADGLDCAVCSVQLRMLR